MLEKEFVLWAHKSRTFFDPELEGQHAFTDIVRRGREFITISIP